MGDLAGKGVLSSSGFRDENARSPYLSVVACGTTIPSLAPSRASDRSHVHRSAKRVCL